MLRRRRYGINAKPDVARSPLGTPGSCDALERITKGGRVQHEGAATAPTPISSHQPSKGLQICVMGLAKHLAQEDRE